MIYIAIFLTAFSIIPLVLLLIRQRHILKTFRNGLRSIRIAFHISSWSGLLVQCYRLYKLIQSVGIDDEIFTAVTHVAISVLMIGVFAPIYFIYFIFKKKSR